jgi:integrase/recombinase XerD
MEINVVLAQSFEKWLKTLGYADSTIYLSGRYVNDFFFYLKSQNITSLEQIQPTEITGYYKHLQTRPQKKQPGGLSNNYITSNINALKRFNKYLQITGKGHLEITLKTRVDKHTIKTILTQEEIKALYKACDNDYLGVRDRAILSIYYGCGLRRTEGINLDVKDILLKEKLVFVGGGKGYKERYVPMSEAVKEDLENYLYQGRSNSLEGCGPDNESFFITYCAKRMGGGAVINRIQKLALKAGINKTIGLHTLRHSIATHLLQSGMTLEEVSQFLGHSSLESTQIYTHLAYA